jgi:hypothetical protein
MMGASSTGGRPPVGGGIPGVGAAAAAAVTKQVAKKWKSWGPGNKIYGTTDALEHSARVREIAAAERLAQRGDVEVVWMGGAAREQFKVAVGTQKFPDVIAKKRGVNAYIVSDGKGGVKMPKAIEQFEAAGKTLSANGGRVVENEVLVPPLRPLTQVAPPPQALLAKGYQRLKVVGSLDGREWAVDEAGWLVRTAADPWQHVLANGQRIRVVVVSQ